MGALEARLHDINERLAASSVEVAVLGRVVRRRESIFVSASDVRERLEHATAIVQEVEAEIRSSPQLFRYALHRRRIEGFLAPDRKEGFVAAALYLVVEHELTALDEELAQLDTEVIRLSGAEHKHRMLGEWRDELIVAQGPGRFTAAEHAIERVSAAVEVADRAQDLRLVEEAHSLVGRALSDLAGAREILAMADRVNKDDLAALADIVPEGTRHFGLRECKRLIEQATLRLAYVLDELRSVEGLEVKLRHPYDTMEAFLGGLFDDFHGEGYVAQGLAAVEEGQVYLELTLHALERAAEQAGRKLEEAKGQESQVVGRAVEVLRPTPMRIRASYSQWDPAPVLRRG